MSQKIWTKNFGMLEVERSWVVVPKQNEEGKIIREGGHIAQLTNGAFVHITGLPFNSEEEIKKILSTPELRTVRDEALEWFRNRGQGEETPLPKIMFDNNGYPLFEDGTPVEKMDDLYMCLQPGPVLTAAIIGLNKKMEAEQAAAGQKRDAKPGAPAPTMPADKKKAAKKAKRKPPVKSRVNPKAPEAPPQQVSV